MRAVALVLVTAAWLSFAGCSSDPAPAPAVAEGDGGADSGAASDETLSADGSRPACIGNAGGGTTIPAPRGDASGAIDALGRRFVLFGGDVSIPVCGQPPAPQFSDETWVLDVACGEWRKLQTKGPSARARYAVTTDTKRGRALIFGGRFRDGGTTYTLFDDVWAFDFKSEAWEKLATKGSGPSARANAAAVYDTARDRLVVFGGNTSGNGLQIAPSADTFALDLTTLTWSALSSGAAPPARTFHGFAASAKSGKAYAFSGGDSNAFLGPFFQDTWELDLATGAWRELATSGATPLGRINMGLVFDDVDGKLVLFGGHDDGKLGNANDRYTLDVSKSPAVWAKAAGGDVFQKEAAGQCDFPPDFTAVDKAVPERRSAFAFAARSDGHGMLVVGGKTDCGVTADAWWLPAGTGKWEAVSESPSGLSCLRVSTTCTSLCN